MSAYSVDVGSVAQPPSAYLGGQFVASETTVAGRPTVNFTANTAESNCNLAIAVAGGSAIIAVVPSRLEMTREQSCTTATDVAEVIASTFP